MKYKTKKQTLLELDELIAALEAQEAEAYCEPLSSDEIAFFGEVLGLDEEHVSPRWAYPIDKVQ